MQIGILGPLVARRDDGTDVPIAGSRLRRLLARLAVDPGRAVPVAELVDAVWLDDPPGEVANALQSLISRLRRVLGDATAIRQASAGYLLDVTRDDVDAFRFADQAAAGRRHLAAGDPSAALDALGSALRLWRGTPLADADGADYAVAPITRWEELRVGARADRISAELALGHAAGVVAELEALVAGYPLREQVVGLLMRALAATGRTGDALAAYEALRERLADGLGADPGPDLQAQHLTLLRGERAPFDDHAAGRRTNLRAEVSSFIGRDAELARIGELVGAGRLVTIVGPGGAGKTRLAARAAAGYVDRRRDGVWLVELAPVGEDSAISQAVLGALGMREAKLLERRGDPRATMSATDRVLDVLAGSDALLVVDNCEHLVAAVAEFVENLLARCPSVKVLATSREPLGLVGESVVAVPPLGLPPAGCDAVTAVGYPAVTLLAQRGRAAAADFAVTAGTVTAVVDIVRRLDGLPLAIELAAARLRVLPVTEIAARLSDRFRLLAGGVRTSVARHRTLRAVVEWSWELLTPAERLLAERLAVFPAGTTTAAAQQICADDSMSIDAVADLLMSLADKSLLQVVSATAGARYRMLETIREYGVEKLEERGELASARARHAGYFAELAHRLNPVLRTADQLSALAEFAAEYDNMTAALRFAGDSGDGETALILVLDLGWFWNIIGDRSEMGLWGEFALGCATEPSPARTRVEASRLLARLEPGADDGANWEVLQSEFAELARQLAEIDDGSDAMTTMARMYIGFFNDFGQIPDELLELGRTSRDPWMRAMSLAMHVYYLENNGDIDTMRAEIGSAYEAFAEIGDRWGLSSLLTVRAGLRSMDGDMDGAVADFERAQAYLEELGSVDDDMIIHLRMAGLRIRQGDFDAARMHIERVRTGRGDRPVPLEQALMGESAVVGLLLAQGQVVEAAVQAEQVRRRMPTQIRSNPIYGHLVTLVGAVCGMTAVRAGDLPTARADLRRAYPAALATYDRPLMAAVAVAVATLAEALGRAVDAAEILGAGAALRGGEDHGDLSIAWVRDRLVGTLGRTAFDAAYATGQALDKETAAKRMDPGLLEDDEDPPDGSRPSRDHGVRTGRCPASTC